MSSVLRDLEGSIGQEAYDEGYEQGKLDGAKAERERIWATLEPFMEIDGYCSVGIGVLKRIIFGGK